MDLTETQIGSEPIFNGTFVTIACDTVRLPNGNDSKRIVIRHPGAACVLAETPDGKIVFVRQWRYATGQALLELPAGKLDAGEDPAACALRELAEETPYAAEKWNWPPPSTPRRDSVTKKCISTAPSTSAKAATCNPTKTNSSKPYCWTVKKYWPPSETTKSKMQKP